MLFMTDSLSGIEAEETAASGKGRLCGATSLRLWRLHKSILSITHPIIMNAPPLIFKNRVQDLIRVPDFSHVARNNNIYSRAYQEESRMFSFIPLFIRHGKRTWERVDW